MMQIDTIIFIVKGVYYTEHIDECIMCFSNEPNVVINCNLLMYAKELRAMICEGYLDFIIPTIGSFRGYRLFINDENSQILMDGVKLILE